MRKDFITTAALIIVLLFLIFFRPFYGWQLRSFFAPDIGAKAGLDLRLENEKLKAEISKFNIIKSQIPERVSGYIPAMIYSRYPFNFKNEFLISIGKNDGVAAGKPVLFGDVLLGQILKVFDENALVQTVFDERFKLSVGIGNFGVKALFKGGSLPKLSLISLSGLVNDGDIVYSISPDFPYGIPIGEVENINLSSDRLFREASLKLPYDLNEIKTVLVKK